MNKTVFIPWSGGLDSTSLLVYMLKKGYRITTGYIQIENNANKVKQELAARKVILSKLDAYCIHHGYNAINDRGVVLKIDVLESHRKIVVLAQAPVWITGLVYCTEGFDEVALGYVMNDDAVSYMNEIRNAYRSFAKINTPLDAGIKVPKMTFPLHKSKKDDLKSFLTKERLGSIIEDVWVCEEPFMGEPCGRCVACGRDTRTVKNSYNSEGRKYNMNRDTVMQDPPVTLDESESLEESEPLELDTPVFKSNVEMARGIIKKMHNGVFSKEDEMEVVDAIAS